MRNPTDHFYNEIYSYYYRTVAQLINLALKGELTPEREDKVLNEYSGFSDNIIIERMHILDEWFFMKKTMSKKNGRYLYDSIIEHETTRPLTLLEKRWLKSIISDPRIKLFQIGFEESLDDIQPLFNMEDFVVVGRYGDGDNYEDAEYIHHFRMVLKATRDKCALRLISMNAKGTVSEEPYLFYPDHIEYSELEDKFSVYGYSPKHERRNIIINIGRIIACEPVKSKNWESYINEDKGILVLKLDGSSAKTKNSLERVLIEFSSYNKRVSEADDGDYIIEIEYYQSEEKEMIVLHLMQFAHYIQVISPETIRNEFSNRIERQRQLFEACGLIPDIM